MTEDDLPTGELITSSQLERDFIWHEVVPLGHLEAQFKVCLPKTFQQRLNTVDHKEGAAFVTLAHFQHSQDGIDILIQRQRLPREVSASHWLRISTLQSGKRIKVMVAKNNRFADALLEFTADGTKHLARMATLIAGGHAYLLMASASEDQYSKYKHVFGMFIASWELKKRPMADQVEQRKGWASDFCRFEVPSSWKEAPATSKNKNGNERVLVNLDDDGELNGVIRCSSGPITADKSWLEGIDETLKFWAGLKLSESKVLAQDVPSVQASWVRKASLVRFVLDGQGAANREFEGWLMLISDDKNWVGLSLLTPPESDTERFYVWAFNHRAFAIACESISRM